MSTMCKSRNIDGSIDRVHDPPLSLFPILFTVRSDCEVLSMNLYSLFWEAGAKANGTVPPAKFHATLKDHMRHPLTAEAIAMINGAHH